MKSSDQSPPFEWREIPCASAEAARVEAVRQQELEDPDEVEWIYLRNKDQQWVARRTPRHLGPEPSSKRKSILGALVDNLHLEDLFLR